MKKFFAVLLSKETLTKIILVQVIVLLFMAMTGRGLMLDVSHHGYQNVTLTSPTGGVEVKVHQ